MLVENGVTLASIADEFHTQSTESLLAGAFHIVIAIILTATIAEKGFKLFDSDAKMTNLRK